MPTTPQDPLLPLWQATAKPLAKHAKLRVQSRGGWPDKPVDTIVIGAGVTGLSTALHLAEQGAKVTLLERDTPGGGSTGRANGQVIAGLQKTPDEIIAAYGAGRGERMVEFSGKAPDMVFALIKKYGIKCDAERSGWIQATRSAREMKKLEKLAASWESRGAPVQLLSKSETARLLGTDTYAGGWLDKRNGTIQPLAYARGLAIAAAKAGVDIHCGIDVAKITRRGKVWSIKTNRGVARAHTVVLATNVYTDELEGIVKTLIGRTYLSAYSVQLASQPLTKAQLKSLLPRRHSCGDTEHLRLRYFRLDHQNRFIIGGPGWLTPPESRTATSFKVLEKSARSMFPQLGDTTFDYHWAARDTITPELLPHLYEPCPGLFSAIGYNGRGLAIGTALGSVLARRVLGEAATSLPYPTTQASAVPLNLPAAAAYYWNVATYRLSALHR